MDRDLSTFSKERILNGALASRVWDLRWYLDQHPEIRAQIFRLLVVDVVLFDKFYLPISKKVTEHYLKYDRLLQEFWSDRYQGASLYSKYKEIEDLLEQIPPLKDLGQRVEERNTTPRFSGLTFKSNSLPYLNRSLREKAEIRRPSVGVAFGTGFIMVK